MDDLTSIASSDTGSARGEKMALAAAIAEALADRRPDVPHEEVRNELLAFIAVADQRIAIED